MASNDSREVRTMRHMAWERAKGELHSMIASFWGDGTPGGCDEFKKLKKTVDNFITDVEDNGLHE